MARVTIGMPVYNNERSLAAAIHSLLVQTEKDIEIVISCDPSSDGTWAICEQFAAQDSRIRIFHQKSQLYYGNFLFVLQQATSRYFAWCAGDDTRLPSFVERCAGVLDERPEVVCCVSRCQFTFEGEATRLAHATYPIEGSWEQRVEGFLRDPADNTRMYGVFRTASLRASFPTRTFWAYDYALSAMTLKYGAHAEVPECLMIRDETPSAQYSKSVSRDHPDLLHRLFPALAMTAYLCKARRIPLKRPICRALVQLNLRMHAFVIQNEYKGVHSRLGRFYSFLDRLIWRI
jgi:glycosyltransferase involved in cell wall biosynthesis